MNTAPSCPDCLQQLSVHCKNLHCHWWKCRRCQVTFTNDLVGRTH